MQKWKRGWHRWWDGSVSGTSEDRRCGGGVPKVTEGNRQMEGGERDIYVLK